jgi:hypothetical protein
VFLNLYSKFYFHYLNLSFVVGGASAAAVQAASGEGKGISNPAQSPASSKSSASPSSPVQPPSKSADAIAKGSEDKPTSSQPVASSHASDTPSVSKHHETSSEEENHRPSDYKNKKDCVGNGHKWTLRGKCVPSPPENDHSVMGETAMGTGIGATAGTALGGILLT